jgi:hypothetical protein
VVGKPGEEVPYDKIMLRHPILDPESQGAHPPAHCGAVDAHGLSIALVQICSSTACCRTSSTMRTALRCASALRDTRAGPTWRMSCSDAEGGPGSPRPLAHAAHEDLREDQVSTFQVASPVTLTRGAGTRCTSSWVSMARHHSRCASRSHGCHCLAEGRRQVTRGATKNEPYWIVHNRRSKNKKVSGVHRG